MSYRLLKHFFIVIGFFAVQNIAKAQSGLCPSNLDFEQGDLSGWQCFSWTASNPTPVPGPIPGRHTIIDATTAGNDPFGFFPEMCPNGSGFCFKLGNQINGSQRESVSYTYTIPSTLSVFSMLFYYAVVLENPNGHPLLNQPRFQARIIDMSTNSPLPCVDFDFIASTAPGGFQTSPIQGNLGSIVLFKDWTPVSVNLNAYIGRTIMLEFITMDCSQSGHAGYAYIDVSTICSGAIQGSTVCIGDTVTTLTAPFGFQGYTWYSDNTFSTIISTSQTVTFNPPPGVGTIYPVIVEPFPSFGCRDTLYATITVSPKPIANAGADNTICNTQQVQIGAPPLVAHTYSWIPVGLVSNPIVANPFAGPVTAPTEFIVSMTDLLTGCVGTDTMILSNTIVDTAVATTGNVNSCVGEPGAILSVKNTCTSVQWHELTAGPIAGATGINYSPPVSGIYWADIIQAGCRDSTGNHAVFVHQIPIVLFTPSNDTGCVTNNSFTFTNNSNAPDNAAMTHLWKFSDGITDINTDAVKSFANTGTYNVKLITTTEFGCKDSTNQDVYILPNGIPNFRWDSICTNRPVLFYNLSNEKGSATVNYNWTFNNGGPGSVLKNPSPVVYTIPGLTDVVLKLTALGCENYPDSIIKKVLVNVQKPGITYRTITVPEGSSQFVHVRDTIGTFYNWRPQLQLSSYNTRYTEFFAVSDDVKYLIDITDLHTCVTTDTMQMLILRKPGYYLPTAFTPNGDGLNDMAIPYLVRMKSLKSFSVFNRWGGLIFYTDKEGEGWDGKFKGVTQDSGVFAWILEFVNTQNKTVTEKGTITIIR